MPKARYRRRKLCDGKRVAYLLEDEIKRQSYQALHANARNITLSAYAREKVVEPIGIEPMT